MGNIFNPIDNPKVTSYRSSSLYSSRENVATGCRAMFQLLSSDRDNSMGDSLTEVVPRIEITLSGCYLYARNGRPYRDLGASPFQTGTRIILRRCLAVRKLRSGVAHVRHNFAKLEGRKRERKRDLLPACSPFAVNLPCRVASNSTA